MAKNFDFLTQFDCLKSLHTLCNEAEIRQKTDPSMSVVYARNALEWVMQAIYKIEKLTDDESFSNMNLFEQMTYYKFEEYINDANIMKHLHYIRKIGNQGAHNPSSVKTKESFFTLLNLYEVVGAVLIRFRLISTLAPFNKELIPDNTEIHVLPQPQTPDETLVNAVPETSQEPIHVNQPSINDISEADTRKIFIDMMLREAGWEIIEQDGVIVPSKACVEIKLEGMPNAEGVGYADYILFGRDGKPLAVIEAKKASRSLEVGRQQAELYAQCCKQRYGVLPVIYYTNGLETKVIDGLGYPPRALYSFHSLDDLERLIQKRSRQEIRDMNGDPNIAGRDYQLTAVKKVCEHFNTKHRRALLVMATGTGKTRTAISIVELLTRNNWIKNVLFLADRTSLVSQAFRNFEKLLPNETKEVLNEEKRPSLNKRITFSTYHTVIKYVDSEEKALSIGRFDLIIIDEAHRSIFGKFRSILDYFDSLVVGLTATPRDEVDRSSYELMELDDEPNFSYELREAVDDHYLVNYTPVERTSAILTSGIRYDDLSKEKKEQMEMVWEYEKVKLALDPDEDYHRDIKKTEIDKYIYNIDTIDRVLQDLMENGQKVQGGEVIGKTIIFAANHQHAELIVDRFNHLYPEMGSDFCKLIDYSVNYAQSLIDDFSDVAKLPQIAVSVDMLDTGIDVPEVLNLVFFKIVKSKIKFIQMLGRGTRLCPDVFGNGKDKETFYVFDWCGNIRYFGGLEGGELSFRIQSLSEKLFGLRLDIAVALQAPTYQADEYAKNFHDELKTILRNQLIGLNESRISVRKHLGIIHDFRQEEKWVFVSPVDAQKLKSEVAPLLVSGKEDEYSKRFDLLVLNRQLALVADIEGGGEVYQTKIINIAIMLEQKSTIPQIHDCLDVIREVQGAQFWETVSLGSLERIRLKLRDLIHYLQKKGDNRTFTVNIEDEVTIEDGEIVPVLPKVTYKQKVLEYLSENNENEVIQKIIHLEKLTSADLIALEKVFWEELGSKQDFDHLTDNKPYKGNIAMFVRTVTGIDREKARKIYLDFIKSNELTSHQELCLKEIMDFVCINGDIKKENIRDNAPLNLRNWPKIFGSNLSGVVNLVEQLHGAIEVVA